METALVFSPHADDATIFCGGTLVRLAEEGWRVVLVRVTDDRFDSLGLSVEETLERNRLEWQEAAGILGVAEVVGLGFPTDCLADLPLGRLRERAVWLLRRYRPHTVLSFDLADRFEDNQDHVRVAQAVAEACWVACFDKHHPEHFAEGLEPFAPAERWYFSRSGPEPNHVVDITDHLDQKVRAVCAHRTMMRHVVNQYRLQFRAAGREVPALDAAVSGEGLPVLLERYVAGVAGAVARGAGLPEGRFAEAFRREDTSEIAALL